MIFARLPLAAPKANARDIETHHECRICCTAIGRLKTVCPCTCTMSCMCLIDHISGIRLDYFEILKNWSLAKPFVNCGPFCNCVIRNN